MPGLGLDHGPVGVSLVDMLDKLPSDTLRVDPGRIAAQAVTGIGFLGAGVILRYKDTIRGLTTAACVWVVCAIGLAIGAGVLSLRLRGGGPDGFLFSGGEVLRAALEKGLVSGNDHRLPGSGRPVQPYPGHHHQTCL